MINCHSSVITFFIWALNWVFIKCCCNYYIQRLLYGGDRCHGTEFWRMHEAKQGKDKGEIQSFLSHQEKLMWLSREPC